MSAKSGFLSITDCRDGKTYQVEVTRNAVRGSDLAKIRFNSSGDGPNDGQPLRVLDPGLENIAVVESSITYACVGQHPYCFIRRCSS